VNWLIVLTGASISYYHQNPDRIPDKSLVIRLSCRLREKLALTIMQLIASSFHHNESAWSIKTLAKKTNISEPAITLIVSALQANELITTTGKNNQQYLLSQASENISVDMILAAARSAEESANLRPDDVDAADQINDVILSIDNAITESTKSRTLKDLI